MTIVSVGGDCHGCEMYSIVAAPTNLGLRPPVPGSTPGTSKAPEALREAGLYDRLLGNGATDNGVVLPGRYVDDDGSRPPGQVRNQAQILEHASRLGGRIAEMVSPAVSDRPMPIVLGGDCSLLLGVGLGLPDVSPGSRPGLVHLDGHTDFRHPGNSTNCANLGGEALAAAVGLHWPELAEAGDQQGGHLFEASRVAHVGCRDDDEHLTEAARVLGAVIPASVAMRQGVGSTLDEVTHTTGGQGYWVQLDVDILDPRWMPAVDSPDPGGLNPEHLAGLLRGLLPGALGLSVTIFDPDLDPAGQHAALLVDLLSAALIG